MNKFHEDDSCSRFIDCIKLPILIIHACDDPLFPELLLEYPKKLLAVNKNALFLKVPHGGHLGFFEGGFVVPNRITWLDRMLVEFIRVTLDEIDERK